MTDIQRPTRYLHHEHAPTEMELHGVKVVITRDGKIELSQMNKDEHGDEVEDVINIKPGFIFRLASIISAGRKKVWKDHPFKSSDEEKDEDDND